jgi:hypothetical protein
MAPGVAAARDVATEAVDELTSTAAARVATATGTNLLTGNSFWVVKDVRTPRIRTRAESGSPGYAT